MSSEAGWKTYQDFVLKIERAGEGQYRVEASAPAGGKAQATFELPFDATRLENFLLKVGHPRRIPTRGHVPDEMQPAVEFGQQLYQAVICDQVRDLFVRASQDAEHHDQGLRLQLRLVDAPELGDIPWEFLNDGYDFLALSAETPIVRYLDLPDTPRPIAVDPPLRILVTISAPHGMPALDTEAEKTKLLEALASLQESGAVTVDFTADATLRTLENTLLRAQSQGHPYHVWHYIGHGAYVESQQASVLAFADDANQLHRVGALALGTLFDAYPEIRLVLLNACEGARPDPQDPFAGVAAALVRQGVPAVIGMQFEVSDEAAKVLSEAFYTALAFGLPVDAALAKARRAVFFMPNWAEWATPVLYMRAPDGRLFQVSPITRPPDVTEPVRPGETQPARPALQGKEPEQPAGRERRSWPVWGWIVLGAVVLLVAGGILLKGRPVVAPTATPSPTTSPQALSTDTPVPTATMTPQPTATPPECTREVGSRFGDIWSSIQKRPEGEPKLGCPKDQAHLETTLSAWQPFENGRMLWRQVTDEIYVLEEGGQAWIRPDTFQEGDLEKKGYDAPEGKQEPIRGFGRVWRDLGGPDAIIGWATKTEKLVDNLFIQNFEHGFIFTGDEIGRYVVFTGDGRAGQWEQK